MGLSGEWCLGGWVVVVMVFVVLVVCVLIWFGLVRLLISGCG